MNGDLVAVVLECDLQVLWEAVHKQVSCLMIVDLDHVAIGDLRDGSENDVAEATRCRTPRRGNAHLGGVQVPTEVVELVSEQ